MNMPPARSICSDDDRRSTAAGRAKIIFGMSASDRSSKPHEALGSLRQSSPLVRQALPILEDRKRPDSDFEEQRTQHRRHGEPWPLIEDMLLRVLWFKVFPLHDISEILGRNEHAIKKALQRLKIPVWGARSEALHCGYNNPIFSDEHELLHLQLTDEQAKGVAVYPLDASNDP